jgi:hypothetical protein
MPEPAACRATSAQESARGASAPGPVSGSHRRTLATTAALFLLFSLGSCENPAEPFADLQSTSSMVQGHTHRATVRGADIADPPASVDIVTTTASATGVAPHDHTVTLLKSDLTVLQESGGSVEVGTNPDATGHQHLFIFTQ